MEDFEEQLRNALRRKEQPAWFEAKVLAAASAGRPQLALPRWALAAAVVVLIAAGIGIQHEHAVRERAAGEAAKARLQLALKITVTELSKIQKSMRTTTEDE
jgi:hypothetical protein